MPKTAESGRFFGILAAAVACGQSLRAAAETAGCGDRTAYRLAAMPEFRAEVSRLRAAALDRAVGEISSGAVKAVRKLIELLDDPPQALPSAKAILQHVGGLSELGELRQRLDALESRSR